MSKGEILFERIGKGINVDVSRLEGGPPEKVLYDPAQYDAVKAAGKTNPDRTLGIGGPGFNGGRELEEFVTPEYLTYRLEDGSGFEDDTNIIGIFHMYQPHKFTHGTSGLDEVPGWKDEVREQMSHPVAWSKKWRKPLLLRSLFKTRVSVSHAAQSV